MTATELLAPERRVGTVPGNRYPIEVDPRLWALHLRYARDRTPDDLSLLVDEYEAYARSIAYRWARHREQSDDLTQVALEALVSSLQRFDPDRGRPFAAFATPTITGALKRHYRDLGWSLRTPRGVHDLARPLRLTREGLTASLGRSPTTAEVADAMDIGADVITAVDRATDARAVGSLDRALQAQDPATSRAISHLDPDLVMAEDRIVLAAELELLDPEDRDLLELYFVDDLTQREIAHRAGCSQMHISRRLTRVLRHLHCRMLS